jgi:hypothetical protein
MASAVTEPVILDSVTHLTEAHRGRVVHAASHGGRYAAYYAAFKGVAAVVLNDAGIGRERVGVSGCGYLEQLGVPSAAISSLSARIGDGRDGHANGIVSHVNALAERIGVRVGMRCRESLDLLARAGLAPAREPPAEDEHRREIAGAGRGAVKVIVMDSISLVEASDRDSVVVTGSHGALLGGRRETAIKIPVLAAVCNDAGFGKDQAGVSRLPAMDALGVAGACVSNFSARIGDGRSIYEDGYISALNDLAKRRGGLVGQSCREFVAAMVAAAG